MSCYHRYYPHGCGEPPAAPPDWYNAYGYRPRRVRDEDGVACRDDELCDDDRPRRRQRRRRTADRSEAAAVTTLQSRAETLRAELIRIEEDLATLSAEADLGSET